jgi:natural product precursor
MKNSTNSKLTFKKVLIAKLNDSQMSAVIGGKGNEYGENIPDGRLKMTEPLPNLFANVDTSVMQSYFCKL